MNLVIDDAVEVRLATKTEEEKRRPLGTMKLKVYVNTANAQQAKSFSRETMSL